MDDNNPGYGFVPSNSPKKKQLPESTPNPEPRVVNNYFRVFIDPQAVLVLVLLVVVLIAASRFVPALRA